MTSFYVPGLPIPKGSARAFVCRGRAIVCQDNAARQKPWAKAIAVTARAHGVTVAPGPVSIALAFAMPRPKAQTDAAGTVRAAYAARQPATRPDLDKLARCVLDALTGVAWLDDGQVVMLTASKEYGPRPGVAVTIVGGGL